MKKDITSFRLQLLFYYCSIGAVFPLLGSYLKKELMFTGSQVGLIFSLPPLVGLIVLPIWGSISDNIKRPNKLMIILLIISGIFNLLIPQFSQFYFVALFVVLLQIFNRPIGPFLDSYIVKKTDNYNIDYGSIRIFGTLGYVFMCFVASILTKWFSLSIIFIICAVFLFLTAINTTRLPELEKQEKNKHFFEDLKKLKSNKKFFLLTIIYTLIFTVSNVSNGYDGIRLTELGLDSSYIWLVTLSLVSFELMIMSFSGVIIKRKGFIFPLVIGALAMLLKWVIYYTTNSAILFILFASLHGLMVALVLPSAIAFLDTIVPRNINTTAYTILVSINMLFSSALSYLSGYIYEKSHLYNVYLLYFILTAIGILIIYRLKKCFDSNFK